MTARSSALPVSVAIPTYRREQLLVDTVEALLKQDPPAAEILVLDQTEAHEPQISARLQAWDDGGDVRWIRLSPPSIPAAMNVGLRAARSPIVLFVDDDVIPGAGLVAAHARNYEDGRVAGVVGQIMSPGQRPVEPSERRGNGIYRDLDFPFHATVRCEVDNCRAANLSVRRETAMAVGGFDERFVGVAFRFETEFWRRLAKAGARLFDPSATLLHLQAPSGGTRVYGQHLRSARPEHGVGDYYFAFGGSRGAQRLGYVARRLFREVRTRYHLRHPWWIPVKLVGELRALVWAVHLRRQGPRYAHSVPPDGTS